jgi:hypothetical protein
MQGRERIGVEDCASLFPCRRKPPLSEQLGKVGIAGHMWPTSAVCDLHLMNSVCVVHGEVSSVRDGHSTPTTTMVELYDKAQAAKRTLFKDTVLKDLQR